MPAIAPEKLDASVKALEKRVDKLEKDSGKDNSAALDKRLADLEKKVDTIDQLVKSMMLNGTKTSQALASMKSIIDKNAIEDDRENEEIHRKFSDQQKLTDDLGKKMQEAQTREYGKLDAKYEAEMEKNKAETKKFADEQTRIAIEHAKDIEAMQKNMVLKVEMMALDARLKALEAARGGGR